MTEIHITDPAPYDDDIILEQSLRPSKFDEFIGQTIPIYLYEISHGTEKTMDQAIIIYTVCFMLFRFFDILKPFPVSYFDKKQKNSFGVVMDDVCAGLYVVLSLICFMILKSLI